MAFEETSRRLARNRTGLTISVLIGLSGAAFCQPEKVGRTVSVRGPVFVQRSTGRRLRALRAGDTLFLNDKVQTGHAASATLQCEDYRTTLGENTTFTVRPTGGKNALLLLEGKLRALIAHVPRRSSRCDVQTETAVTAVRGTDFLVEQLPDKSTRIAVVEGQVAVANVEIPDREVLVSAGQESTVQPGYVPTPPSPVGNLDSEMKPFEQASSVLERGEDPLIEETEIAPVEKYLAVP